MLLTSSWPLARVGGGSVPLSATSIPLDPVARPGSLVSDTRVPRKITTCSPLIASF